MVNFCLLVYAQILHKHTKCNLEVILNSIFHDLKQSQSLPESKFCVKKILLNICLKLFVFFGSEKSYFRGLNTALRGVLHLKIISNVKTNSSNGTSDVTVNFFNTCASKIFNSINANFCPTQFRGPSENAA